MESTFITEVLPSVERFINNTGFPITMLIIIAYFAQRLGKKLYQKLEPIMDSHLSLVNELKETSKQQLDLTGTQNQILVSNFQAQKELLQDHSSKLEEIKSLHMRNVCLAEKLIK